MSVIPSTFVESTALSVPLNALLEAMVACEHLNRWGQSQIKQYTILQMYMFRERSSFNDIHIMRFLL
jgi:hypothetical protein